MTAPAPALEPASPAHDQHAEFSLLASLVWGDPDVLATTWREVAPDELYHPTYAALAEVIHSLDQVSPGLLPAEIRKHHDPQQVDAMLRLLPTLATWERFDVHAALYARTIRGCARRRQLQRLARRLDQQAVSPTSDVDDLIVGLIDTAEGMVTGAARAVEPPATADLPATNPASPRAGRSGVVPSLWRHRPSGLGSHLPMPESGRRVPRA